VSIKIETAAGKDLTGRFAGDGACGLLGKRYGNQRNGEAVLRLRSMKMTWNTEAIIQRELARP